MLGSFLQNGWFGTKQAPPAESPRGASFHLWIDGVGGYLVCMGNPISIGQATPDASVDVPLLAEVSRMHASLMRDSEGYSLQAAKPTRVNGRVVTETSLRDGDLVTLGSCCQLRFRQPVLVSTSARLDVVSGHRLRLAVDGVLIMADTLVLGPGQQVHVSMPDLKDSVILFRQKSGLGVCSPGSMTINGQSVRGRGELAPGARVEGEEFSFALEAVGGS